MSKIVIVSGSPAQKSRTFAVASYLEQIISKKDHDVAVINVRDLPSEDLLYANFNSPAIQEATLKIEEAEAVIVVSPVYKASYPGILKAFFDLIPEKGLSNKLIFPVITAGTFAHLLSIEYAFKPLFSVLGAQEQLSGVYIIDSQLTYKENTLTSIESEIEQRLHGVLQQLLTKLEKKK
jgi:FMN reductase